MRSACPARDTAALPGLQVGRPEREPGRSTRERGSIGNPRWAVPSGLRGQGVLQGHVSHVRGVRGPALSRGAVKVSHGRSSSITMCPRQGGRGGLETALPERWRGSAACKPTDRTLASRSQPQETGVPPTTAWSHGPLGAAADPAPSTGWAARQRQAAGGLGTARAAASPAGGRVHTRRPGAVTTQPSSQTCE